MDASSRRDDRKRKEVEGAISATHDGAPGHGLPSSCYPDFWLSRLKTGRTASPSLARRSRLFVAQGRLRHSGRF